MVPTGKVRCSGHLLNIVESKNLTLPVCMAYEPHNNVTRLLCISKETRGIYDDFQFKEKIYNNTM